MKDSITVQDICDLLNWLLDNDPECLKGVINFRQKCNKITLDHPTIVVRDQEGDEFPTIGIIGLLNGFFGKRESDGFSPICRSIDRDTGRLIKFMVTPDQRKFK